MFKRFSLALLFCLGLGAGVQAQDDNSDALEYIRLFNQEFAQMQHLQIEYSSLLVHRREEVAARKRIEIIRLIEGAKGKFQGVEQHPKDKGLRASAIETITLLHDLVNKDYDEVIESKVGCKKCFEAVILEFELSEQDSKEISKSMEKMQKQIKKFADDNKIELVSGENEYDNLIGKINRLNAYTQQLDLVLLQVNYADAALIEAFNENDLKKAKDLHKKLSKAISEARGRFKKVKAIPEDKTCYQHLDRFLTFYEEADKKIYPEMFDAFDKSGKVKNDKVNSFNKNIEKLGKNSATHVTNYYQAKDNLMKRHVPPPSTPELKRT